MNHKEQNKKQWLFSHQGINILFPGRLHQGITVRDLEVLKQFFKPKVKPETNSVKIPTMIAFQSPQGNHYFQFIFVNHAMQE